MIFSWVFHYEAMDKDLQSSSERSNQEVKTRSSKWLHSHNCRAESKQISIVSFQFASSRILALKATPSGSLLSLIQVTRRQRAA